MQKGKSKTLTKTETGTEIGTATETETGTDAEDGTETCISAFHFAAVGAARDVSLHKEPSSGKDMAQQSKTNWFLVNMKPSLSL